MIVLLYFNRINLTISPQDFKKHMPYQYRLLTFYPHPVLSYGIGHAALSIIEAMKSDTLDVQLICLPSINSAQSMSQKVAVPSLVARIFYKLNLAHVLHKLTEHYFLHQLKPHDIAYLWPRASLSLHRKIKAKGNLIITENINCHRQIAKKIIESEEIKLGIKNLCPITPELVIEESKRLELSDFIFSPSPLVTQSLTKSGVPRGKILESSYGLHEYQQLNIAPQQLNSDKPVTAIFVGRVGMRKGIHLLLEYWKSANIDGILKVIGNIEDPIRETIAPYQNISNIQFIEFVPDIEKIYSDADLFVLPSLEEGSPLVTYLALGAGLPCIVSPMAGEGIITDGEEGFIIEPHDKTKWIDALQKLFASTSLRQSQSQAARKKADTFLWKNVGHQRADLLLKKLQRK